MKKCKDCKYFEKCEFANVMLKIAPKQDFVACAQFVEKKSDKN